MSASQRNKGARWELEIVELLTTAGFPASRAFASGGGKGGGGDIAGVHGWSIEVKRTNRLQILAALDQASEACRQDENPLVFFRPDHRPWHVALRATDAVRLLQLDRRERGV